MPSLLNPFFVGNPTADPASADWDVVEHMSAPVDGVFDFTGLDLTGFERVAVVADGLTVDTDGAELHLHVYVDGALKASGYSWLHHLQTSANNTATGVNAPGTAVALTAGTGDADYRLGNAAGESYSGRIEISGAAGSLAKLVSADGALVGTAGSFVRVINGAKIDFTFTMDGFAIVAVGGLITAGSVTVYSIPSTSRFPDPVIPRVQSLWVGAPTTSGATVAVNLNMDASLRLAVSTSADLTSPTYSSVVATENHRAKLTMTGLSAGTTYYYAVEINGTLYTSTTGQFRTLAASDTSLLVAFAGDADSESDADVFDAIRDESPNLFIHLGDAHYTNIANDNTYRHLGALDTMLEQPKQHELYRTVPPVYAYDDHDYADNDGHAGSAARNAAIRAYRRAVPSYTLAAAGDTDPVYHSFEIELDGIGVVFIVTDQRAAASDKAATDDSSKTMLGATQKTWFKNLVSDAGNAGKLFVWVCARLWGGVATGGADHWGGFTTERTELADHIKTHAADRFVVLSADGHFLGIDDGTNHDFATGGGCPLPTFQAAPLDQTTFLYGSGTYSEGTFLNNGQYGLMLLSKTGASQLTVDWTGKRDTGATLVTHQMVFNL